MLRPPLLSKLFCEIVVPLAFMTSTPAPALSRMRLRLNTTFDPA